MRDIFSFFLSFLSQEKELLLHTSIMIYLTYSPGVQIRIFQQWKYMNSKMLVNFSYKLFSIIKK